MTMFFLNDVECEVKWVFEFMKCISNIQWRWKIGYEINQVKLEYCFEIEIRIVEKTI